MQVLNRQIIAAASQLCCCLKLFKLVLLGWFCLLFWQNYCNYPRSGFAHCFNSLHHSRCAYCFIKFIGCLLLLKCILVCLMSEYMYLITVNSNVLYWYEILKYITFANFTNSIWGNLYGCSPCFAVK